MTRVLVVLGGLNRGGAETWMIQVAQRMKNVGVQFDFLVHEDGPFHYQAEAEELGSRIIPCKGLRFPPLYALNLLHILKKYGPYQVIHAHVHYYSGIPLLIAAIAGVPVRVVQSHLDTRQVDAEAGMLRRIYLGLMKKLIWNFATVGTAVSRKAADALFPRDWNEHRKWHVMLLGINAEPFEAAVDAEALRQELGIPMGVMVVGHVGRFESQKNHAFLLRVIAEYLRSTPAAVFLLVGDGPLRADIEDQAAELGISKNIRFVGVRKDVPALMRGVMDVLVLPSLFEGLPLVLLEAQAAGLPCLLSDNIAEDSDLVHELISREPLTSSAEGWAARLVSLKSRLPNRARGYPELVGIEKSIDGLIRSYSIPGVHCNVEAFSK